MSTINKINKWLIAFSMLIFLLASCTDVLDKRDLNVIDDIIWEDGDQATLYVNTLYDNNMPDMSLGSYEAHADESYTSSQAITDLIYGIYGSSDIDAVKDLHKDNYQLIRRINICIEGLEGSPLDAATKNPILGQALFFRAWRYWQMVKLYGGIPMVDRVQDPFFEAELGIPRSKTSESIALIVEDLDLAIEYLPVDWTLDKDKGRITSGAAAAFKGRVLLAWASPLFNRNNDANRWQQAYDASTQAVEILAQMPMPRALHSDYNTIFTTDVLSNPEAVIFRRYSANAGSDYTSAWEARVRPPSGGGDGLSTPTWELVQAYPMINGKHINDADSGYDPERFWKNRDLRFYATVAYNGSDWEMEDRDLDKAWTYTRTILENNRVPATGFYNRKATDPTIQQNNVSQTSTSWIELRYAEVLMNLAESANELDKRTEALDLIGQIRNRAGIEVGTGNYGISASISKEGLRELIMIERQVEFAFENKRYWDLRRRLMFRTDLGDHAKKLNGTQRHGLDIRPVAPWTSTITDATSPYRGWKRIDTLVYLHPNAIDLEDVDSYKTYFSTTIKVLESTVSGVQQEFNYPELYDFFAVPSSFLQSSPAVEQTLGWVNGTFDPLAE